MIDNISLLYFSPTKTTKKIVETIALEIKPEKTTHFDLTSPTFNSKRFNEFNHELVIIGVPVYGGRVPVDATKRLQKLNANNIPTIIVVVYGNRDYEDSLIELNDITKDRGFMPFAAATFIGEHSFSTELSPIAQGRPDTNDLNKATEFGKNIRNVLFDNTPSKLISLPGNYPYKTLAVMSNVSPITIDTLCDNCGVCVSVCPTDSIQINEIISTDKTTCILCCACVKECPNNARLIDNDLVKNIRERLFNNCSTRREPEIFINNN